MDRGDWMIVVDPRGRECERHQIANGPKLKVKEGRKSKLAGNAPSGVIVRGKT